MTGFEDQSKELLARAIGGDHEAVVTLLDGCSTWLRSMIGQGMPASLRGEIDTDDVMQVVSIKVFTSIRRFKPNHDHAFHAWLRTICRRTLIDLSREVSHRPQATTGAKSVGDSCEDLILQLSGHASGPSTIVGRRELVSKMMAAIDALPPPLPAVVRMCHFEGKTLREAGRVLGCTLSTAWRYLVMAHETLRARLGVMPPSSS